MVKHRRVNIRRWRLAVNAWESSGLGLKEYCKQTRIPENTLCGWRRKVRDLDIDSAGEFEELKFDYSEDSSLPNSSGIEILFSTGLKIKLQKKFDVLELEKTLKALNTISC